MAEQRQPSTAELKQEAVRHVTAQRNGGGPKRPGTWAGTSSCVGGGNRPMPPPLRRPFPAMAGARWRRRTCGSAATRGGDCGGRGRAEKKPDAAVSTSRGAGCLYRRVPGHVAGGSTRGGVGGAPERG
jgi:hypothetical protein